jgi:hypothetical protein
MLERLRMRQIRHQAIYLNVVGEVVCRTQKEVKLIPNENIAFAKAKRAK